ncbi:hypothetical protein DAEQUDRAFT_761550 [Daedalea quercina L-15889]|uniref:Uncharacterized protein n=1 Tax=Daedalea quercina L-15889 TaxID=1314783 RepID=A0A165TXK1_9APHY|nr:hypothetical protein DAEQUDRAFT_761550 [Daedalea quercina L-15889]
MARKDRKPKQFLESKDEALKLAQSVAIIQDDISKQKVKRHIQRVETTSASSKKHTSKEKLKQVKAGLASEAAKAKREKARARKQAKKVKRDTSTGDTHIKTPGNKSQPEPAARPQKRVNFAD